MTTLQLEQFTGTTQYYRATFGGKYTDGIHYLVEKAKCHWLVDDIFIYQMEAKIKRQPFQVWHLEVEGSSAYLSMSDGNNNEIFKTYIPYTDFPLQQIDLWLISGVLILPSEY